MITAPTKYHEQPGECFMRSTVPEEVPCAACTSGVVEGIQHFEFWKLLVALKDIVFRN